MRWRRGKIFIAITILTLVLIVLLMSHRSSNGDSAMVVQLSGFSKQRQLAHSEHTMALKFLQSGKVIAGIDDNSRLILWRVADGKLLWRSKAVTCNNNIAYFYRVSLPAASHDGRFLLLSAEDSKNQGLWDVMERRLLIKLSGDIFAAAFTADDSRLGVLYNVSRGLDKQGNRTHAVYFDVWDVRTRTLKSHQREYKIPSYGVAAFSSDLSRLAFVSHLSLTSHPTKVTVWKVENFKLVKPYSLPVRNVAAAAFNTKGNELVTFNVTETSDNIQWWPVGAKKPSRRSDDFKGYFSYDVYELDVSADGRAIAMLGVWGSAIFLADGGYAPHRPYAWAAVSVSPDRKLMAYTPFMYDRM